MFADLAIPGKFTFEIDEVRLEPSAPSAADPANTAQLDTWAAPTGAAPRPAAAFLPVGSPRQPGAATYANRLDRANIPRRYRLYASRFTSCVLAIRLLDEPRQVHPATGTRPCISRWYVLENR
jgi:hypothetical protein